MPTNTFLLAKLILLEVTFSKIIEEINRDLPGVVAGSPLPLSEGPGGDGMFLLACWSSFSRKALSFPSRAICLRSRFTISWYPLDTTRLKCTATLKKDQI